MSKLIPASNVEAVGLGIGRRSIGRRIKNPPDGFPAPIKINGRLYFDQDALENYKHGLINGTFSRAGPTSLEARDPACP
jgi:hypothetical protein